MPLTPEQINAMDAGPEMDAAVAEAMGYRPVVNRAQFSVSLTAAYGAAYAMLFRLPEATEMRTISFVPRGYVATYHDDLERTLHLAAGDTLPHALCRLVLLASLDAGPAT